MYIRLWGTISFGILPCLSFAAGLEKSNQSISPFLEKGNYLELSAAYISPHVSGKVTNQSTLQKVGVSDFSTGQLIQDYSMFNAALKVQYQPHGSFGFIYDQPYAAELNYQYAPESLLPNKTIEAAKFQIESQNLTHLWGYQPNQNWNFYTGFALQEFKGHLSVDGLSYSIMSGYQAQIKPDTGVGWLTGVSYQIPEYAFSSSITYRSKIKHESHILESLADQALLYGPNDTTKIETPQSVNIYFKTGISQNNLLFSSLRWVNWQDFHIQPSQFSAILDTIVTQYPDLIQKFNLIDYKQDQWTTQLGLAHRLNQQWIISTDFIWDSGTGNPAGTLNPSDGFYALGIGAMYRIQPNSFIAAGVKYFQLNKAEITSNNHFVAGNQNTNLDTVNPNYALAYGLKIGHSF